jgi:hypothetical protein
MGINENLQPVTWAVSMPFVVITGLTSILRVYSRVCISNSFGVDDWFMAAASVSVLLLICDMSTDPSRSHGLSMKASWDR